MTNEAAQPLEQPGATSLSAERRGAERYPCELQPFWCVVGETPVGSALARVRDVSATGIGLLVSEPLKPGSVLVIKLQTQDQRLSRPLPARVMHATAQANGDWIVGCQFVRPLSPQDLRAVVAVE